MHQSLMLPIQWSYTFAQRCGWKRIWGSADVPSASLGVPPNETREEASGATPDAATGTVALPSCSTHARDFSTLGYFKNHCSLRYGSMGT